jgi:DNA-binding MarR family transcriptional regulator
MNDILYTQLNHCINLLHRLQSSQYRQLPQGQGKILRILAKHGTLSHKELAECMQIRSPSTTELVLKLENKGYVARAIDATDRRVFNVSLTDKGREEARVMETVNNKLLRDFFSNLSLSDKQHLSKLLCKAMSASVYENACVSFCKECGICSMGYKKLISSG